MPHTPVPDIVQRLRAGNDRMDFGDADLHEEAAKEIERLRSELRRVREGYPLALMGRGG